MTKLFVYGSLRKGCYNHHYIKDFTRIEGLFYVKGNIFTIRDKKYPALVLPNNENDVSSDFTVGELYEFPKNTDLDVVFRNMDKMEGYYGENCKDNEYNRFCLDVYDEKYEKITNAYVYVYNLENPLLKDSLDLKIKDNDYLNIYDFVTEKEKMLKGELYSSTGEELTKERLYAKELCFDYNNTRPSDIDRRNGIIGKLFGKVGKGFWIESGFICDYGYNIHAGDNLYINHNCVILDCAKVTFGNNVMIAPNVGIYTAGHPLDVKTRHVDLLEFAHPVTVGSNVWIGANSIILPGVSIGDNSVIGAGSVVTKDIPENVIAVGNPCKVIRSIHENEK